MGTCGTVLVVDSDQETRHLITAQVEALGLSCRAVATSDAALTALREDEPSLAVVEVELPGLNGFGLLHALHEHAEHLPVILVASTHADALARAAGLMLGADDFVVKPLDPTEFMARMRRSLRRSAKPVEATRARPRQNGHMPTLSPREREILTLLAEAKTQTQIAADLVLSTRTVATHIQNLLRKLGVHSRAEAIVAAYRGGLVGVGVDADMEVDAHVLTHADDGRPRPLVAKNAIA